MTLKQLNQSNVAHIIASSPQGPRGDEKLSFELSDDIDNLMLMCPVHHKLIDSNCEEYSVEILKTMKRKHEEAIELICESAKLEPSTILCFQSPIKGTIKVGVEYKKAVEAVLEKNYPEDSYGVTMNIESGLDYCSREYWEDIRTQIKQQYNMYVESRYSAIPNNIFSIFPLAPIPAIVYLGYLMSDKKNVNIYQKTREPDTWKWQSRDLTNQFHITHKRYQDGARVALVLSLTAEISCNRIDCVGIYDHIYIITASNTGVDSIKSEKDLSEFWHCYQSVCDEMKNSITGVRDVCVYPAIPVSAAFEIGRRYMPGIYPILKIYEDNNGFFETLAIGDD